MTITSPKLDTSHLTANEAALLRCQTALELKDRGDYEAAEGAMHPIWKGLGEIPDTQALHPSVAAEVLLCVGILTGWIGSRADLKWAQEVAKNLITESITYYESVGDLKKIAAARAEIAYCYWREGELGEARIMLREALQRLTLEANTRARALLKLAIVEWSASRHHVALEILADNAPLFEKVTNNTIKGTYHNQLAIVLRHLAQSEKRDEYIQRAIAEFEKADRHFKLARNNVFRASVKNNLGLILLNLARFRAAHKYLAEARRLSVIAKDKIRTAQFDESRAQVLIAEKRFSQAESIVRGAISVLEKSGQQCLLTDALITHGVALARLGEKERAQFVLERAIETAHQVGALNKAGLAALTLIEELGELPPVVLFAAYERAADWLADSQSLDTLRRLNEAARKIFLRLHAEMAPEDAKDAEFNAQDLPQAILRYEETLIRQALAKANGSVTRAAALLGISYQGLAYTIEARHKDLLRERTPIRRRSRKEIREDKRSDEDPPGND
jgi:tetratricopeptide (TPR) repeat protein